MNSAIKDLGLGLVIGMCATLLVGMAILLSLGRLAPPPPRPSPSLSASPFPTLTASAAAATATASATEAPPPSTTPSPLPPTSTPDAVQSAVHSGALVFAGALSNQEQLALYRSSLEYVASGPADSLRMAKQVNGVGYGDPTNICGPLAIAILHGAGLMSPKIIPHDFWLLNPRAALDQRLLREAFPAELYAYSRTLTPINRIDWRSSPLLPGDFVFIWHGSGGNFDHMLVVSRVDSQLRVYAVTNYGTAEGYVIGEAMLYDPNDPTVGLFHMWTQEQYAILGSTGFGGFELWRRTQP